MHTMLSAPPTICDPWSFTVDFENVPDERDTFWSGRKWLLRFGRFVYEAREQQAHGQEQPRKKAFENHFWISSLRL